MMWNFRSHILGRKSGMPDRNGPGKSTMRTIDKQPTTSNHRQATIDKQPLPDE